MRKPEITKKDVDPDEAPGEPWEVGVAQDHQTHGYRP